MKKPVLMVMLAGLLLFAIGSVIKVSASQNQEQTMRDMSGWTLSKMIRPEWGVKIHPEAEWDLMDWRMFCALPQFTNYEICKQLERLESRVLSLERKLKSLVRDFSPIKSAYDRELKREKQRQERRAARRERRRKRKEQRRKRREFEAEQERRRWEHCRTKHGLIKPGSCIIP